MYRFRPFLSLTLALIGLSACTAQELPAPNAKRLSEIVQLVEQRPDYQAIEYIARYNGTYEVEYKTREGRRRTLWINAVSGIEH